MSMCGCLINPLSRDVSFAFMVMLLNRYNKTTRDTGELDIFSLFCTGILNNGFGRNINLASLDEILSRMSTWKIEKTEEV
jgi:hypothetical protein